MPDTEPDVTTSDQSPRETMIRDLYAMIAFYAAHPNLPVPALIQATHVIGSRDELGAIAALLGADVTRPRRLVAQLPGTDGRVRLHFTAVDQ
jgi:hypothetical protein